MHQPTTGFAALGVPAPLCASLTSGGITSPFPIQVATLPDALAGRDVLGRGRTGSGKTLAFALPVVARLAEGAAQPGAPRGLVLVPTRELANQVLDTITPLARAVGLRAVTIFGGVGQAPQVAALRRGVDIVVATPGRLEDLMGQGHVRLGDVTVTVLDEADHMADLGFLPAVRRILDRTPATGQRMLFSATLDDAVDLLVRRYLSDPAAHRVDEASSPVPAMEHHVLDVAASDKAAVVTELVSGRGRVLAFTRTKHGARKLARTLTAQGVPAVDLHGNLSQNARERNLAAFAAGEVNVLVATDIAARGIHVDEVALVVHVDPPAEHKAYLHRSGRTARAGAAGAVVTVSTPETRGDVRTMMRMARIRPTTAAVAPGDAAIQALTGPWAPRVTPAPAPGTAGAPRSGRSGGASGSGRSAGASGGRPGRGASAGSSRAPGRGRSGRAAPPAASSSRPARGARTAALAPAEQLTAASFSASLRRSR
ncbi:MAG: DEAD/DEAH box helicase [Candidatus Nanopelagicales bacterium]|jgi:superfamily II DNA/RNA helicase|nr:DEAD/DEAH box helicase [Candidatus Nanopelagicales bacterium]